MTEPNAPAAPPPDPALALRGRLLDLSAWLRTARAGFAEHRRALDSYASYAEHSTYATALARLVENAEKTCEFLVREVARAGQELAADAFKAALRDCPPPAGDAAAKP